MRRSLGALPPLLLDLGGERFSTEWPGPPTRPAPRDQGSVMSAELRQIVSAHGGAVATHELHTAGYGRNQIALAVRRRQLLRVRQGWYVRPDIHPDLIRAARIGGAATCTSALDLLGFWVVTDDRLHVRVPGNACQLRSPGTGRRRLGVADRATVHWQGARGGSRLLVDAVAALEDLCVCASPELVAASADSVLRADPRRRHEIITVAGRMPRAYRDALLLADGVCESGTETLFWLRMRRLRPRRQVRIAGVGRVDFLLGDRLVVEVDGAAYHSDPLTFEADRTRDALLSALGYRVLRFSYRQIMDRWAEVEAAVQAAIFRGDHL